MKTGTADLPLHYGHCPPWLFKRMKLLAGAIAEAIVLEYGHDEFLRRMADPFFFQSLGCVVGFDWHSSGLSTTLCGALKEGLSRETGLAVCGGKGKASRNTGNEIVTAGDSFSLSSRTVNALVNASKLSAKVDNTAVQDGYDLYHHVLMLTEKGSWAVVQQGLNPTNHYARRYHWLSENVRSFVEEPHAAICCDSRGKALNMVAKESREARKVSVDMVQEKRLVTLLQKQTTLDSFSQRLELPRGHAIPHMNKLNIETLKRAYELQPQNYEQLLAVKGMGPKTVRSLALIADIVYGTPPSWRDPANYSFAHGGKDGIPYPVDRKRYDRSIEILQTGIEEAKLGSKEKLTAIKQLKHKIIPIQ
jgi:hypothetical protein